jgi:hypothetical protein
MWKFFWWSSQIHNMFWNNSNSLHLGWDSNPRSSVPEADASNYTTVGETHICRVTGQLASLTLLIAGKIMKIFSTFFQTWVADRGPIFFGPSFSTFFAAKVDPRKERDLWDQGCQTVYLFSDQNRNLGKFWRALQRKMLICFMDIWSILRPFGIFLAIWYIVW